MKRGYRKVWPVGASLATLVFLGVSVRSQDEQAAQVGEGEGLATLVHSTPPFTPFESTTIPSNGTLWRTRRHVIRLIFDQPIAAPQAGEILVQQLLSTPCGTPNVPSVFGPDVSAAFEYTVESDVVLRMREVSATQTVLPHRTWFAIRNAGGWPGVADFEIHFPVQVGDADGNRFTTAFDVSFVNGAPFGPMEDQARADMDGDGFRTATDVSITNSHQGPPPLKPCGH